MLNFSKARTTIILLICFLGVLVSIPSLIGSHNIPSWMPARHFNLGLDLQGGSYLLLEVDAEAVKRERLDNATDEARGLMRSAEVRTTGVAVDGDGIIVRLADQADAARATEALRPMTQGALPGEVGDFSIVPETGRLRLAFSQQALANRVSKAVDQSLEIVRRRIDETGVNEPMVARQGASRVLVQLPGVTDPGRIKRLLGQTAKMTFHLVGDPSIAPGSAAPPGFEWMMNADRGAGGSQILVRKRVEVDGATLTDAQPSADPQTGRWVVSFSFDSIGARRFGEITRANVGRPFAIVLDGRIISAPVINEPIMGGRGQISGNFTAQTANELAVLLRAGALPAPLTVVEERSIGPELGADSIKAGLISCLVGVVLVFGYMWMTYGFFGLIANAALIFNLFLTLACLAMLEATLTLPGIAGVVLTLGMSVDANILINERIREELRKGRTALSALEAGYTKAMGTIIDSNLTTLIKMVLLYIVGTGSVKGFAVTTSLGIITSMFTATLVARLLTAIWFRRKRRRELPVKGPFSLKTYGWNVNFMKGRHAGLIVSVILSALSVALFFKPGLNYGIDFAGGIVMEVRTPEPTDFPRLRQVMEGVDVGPVSLQAFGSDRDVILRMERQEGAESNQEAAIKAVTTALEQNFPGTEVRRVEAVGASVSAELFTNGMIALGLAAIAMLFYITIRFEWQFGIGAVITMLLDTTKTIGFYSLTGMQFNLTAIAAMLTIMGFSINDKVVVYDRVRENLRLYRKMPLRELINRSINETMTRTINTSIAIFLSIIPLALYGGEALREFAWALLFGVVLATSSSIFIAAPILLYLGENRLRKTMDADDPPADEPQADGEATSKA
ncbi:protein translocase subunit SecD [Niveispirillum fermenti]|uniref:protein translocase subunit SecD n=1 Tax=Niveispirillum fermenti TaxID=1233113 RepID=UPI003A875325